MNELREKYLSFESKGHLRLTASVPKNDPSLLLITSGMAPMKKCGSWHRRSRPLPPRDYLPEVHPHPGYRARGHTARHGTFFEMMLGNFSFQDYFKDEVIPWAWEFLTSDEWMAIPKDRLHISVYEEDDEAYDIWTKKVGTPRTTWCVWVRRINFWEHGSGPCGPCPRSTLTAALSTAGGKPTLRRAATATAIWRSGTSCSASSMPTQGSLQMSGTPQH